MSQKLEILVIVTSEINKYKIITDKVLCFIYLTKFAKGSFSFKLLIFANLFFVKNDEEVVHDYHIKQDYAS